MFGLKELFRRPAPLSSYSTVSIAVSTSTNNIEVILPAKKLSITERFIRYWSARQFSTGIVVSVSLHITALTILAYTAVSSFTAATIFSGRSQSARIELISTADQPPVEEFQDVPFALALETTFHQPEIEPEPPSESKTEPAKDWPCTEQVALQDPCPNDPSPHLESEMLRRQTERVDCRAVTVTENRPAPRRRSTQLYKLQKVALSDPQTFGMDDRTPPKLESNPSPIYPVEARVHGIEGVVLLRMEIRSDGTVGNVELVKSSNFSILDRAAIETVRKWSFHPARQAGSPVASTAVLPVRFRIVR